MIPALFVLLVCHALCDYPLQGDFLAKGKNRFNPLPGVPWYWCLGAHAMIHAGAVYLVTGSFGLGLLELIAHAAIDDRKCAGKFGFDMDQGLHICCKLLWIVIGISL